ncbi:MAG TPA: hypothetical protein VK681_35835 [Reyranella sp.]|nr:hypothetical protein [Reyranella sp.]
MHFDKAGQHVEEQRALRRREGRQDAFLRGTGSGAQAVVQRLAACTQSQCTGAAVLWVDSPFDISCCGEAMDEVMSAHRIDTQPGRQAALIGIRYFRQRSDHSVLDRRQIGALCNLCRDAKADLMEAPGQMGGHPVPLWNGIGRRVHNSKFSSF